MSILHNKNSEAIEQLRKQIDEIHQRHERRKAEDDKDWQECHKLQSKIRAIELKSKFSNVVGKPGAVKLTGRDLVDELRGLRATIVQIRRTQAIVQVGNQKFLCPLHAIEIVAQREEV